MVYATLCALKYGCHNLWLNIWFTPIWCSIAIELWEHFHMGWMIIMERNVIISNALVWGGVYMLWDAGVLVLYNFFINWSNFVPKLEHSLCLDIVLSVINKNVAFSNKGAGSSRFQLNIIWQEEIDFDTCNSCLLKMSYDKIKWRHFIQVVDSTREPS